MATDASERLIGCAALAIMSGDLAEVRSLAVEPESQGLGLGRRLVGAAMDEARQLGLPKVFALTRAPGFFEKLGFEHTDMKALPEGLDRLHPLPPLPRL